MKSRPFFVSLLIKEITRKIHTIRGNKKKIFKSVINDCKNSTSPNPISFILCLRLLLLQLNSTEHHPPSGISVQATQLNFYQDHWSSYYKHEPMPGFAAEKIECRACLCGSYAKDWNGKLTWANEGVSGSSLRSGQRLWGWGDCSWCCYASFGGPQERKSRRWL